MPIITGDLTSNGGLVASVLSDLVVERIVGMTYNPITGIYKLTDKDLSVNYLMKLSKPL